MKNANNRSTADRDSELLQEYWAAKCTWDRVQKAYAAAGSPYPGFELYKLPQAQRYIRSKLNISARSDRRWQAKLEARLDAIEDSMDVVKARLEDPELSHDERRRQEDEYQTLLDLYRVESDRQSRVQRLCNEHKAEMREYGYEY